MQRLERGSLVELMLEEIDVENLCNILGHAAIGVDAAIGVSATDEQRAHWARVRRELGRITLFVKTGEVIP